MRGLLFILVLLFIALAAAPYIDGMMFKKVYLDRLAIYEKQIKDKNVTITQDTYNVGWFTSTARVKATVTDPNSTDSMPPMVVTIDSVIHHGPFVIDPTTKSFKFAYAVVESRVHAPDLIKAFIPDNGNGFMQVTSTVPFDGKVWYNHYVIQPININGKFKWNGASGQGDIYYSDNEAMRIEGNMTVGALTIPANPATPTIPEVNIQPLTYIIKADQKELNVWTGDSSLTTPGLTIRWADGREIDATTFEFKSSYGLNADKTLYNYTSSAVLSSLKLPQQLVVTNLSGIKVNFALNNLDAKGLQIYMQYLNNTNTKQNPEEMISGALKILTANTTLDKDFYANTNLGATQGALKLSLESLPGTKEQLIQVLNIDVTAKVAVSLLETLVTSYFQHVNAKLPSPQPEQPVQQTQSNLYKQTVAALLQNQKISFNDSLTLMGYENQNLTVDQFNVNIKSMTTLDPNVVTILQEAYAQTVTQKQATPQPATTTVVTVQDPAQQMRKLVDSWIANGYIVKNNNDYTVTFIKRGTVFTLNGKDVSAQVGQLMPAGGTGPVIPTTTTPTTQPIPASTTSTTTPTPVTTTPETTTTTTPTSTTPTTTTPTTTTPTTTTPTTTTPTTTITPPPASTTTTTTVPSTTTTTTTTTSPAPTPTPVTPSMPTDTQTVQ